jgi:hypothetical protein
MNVETNFSQAKTVPALKALIDATRRPTVKVERNAPCNQYYNVVLTNGSGAWTGRVVSFLTLEDWCLLHGYRLWQSGQHLYCDPDGSIKTSLRELDSFVA